MSAQDAAGLGQFALTGGLPIRSQDYAPSIVFAIAFALLLIPAGYRIVNPASRSAVLIRPAIFVLLQSAAFAIRAVIANGNYSTNLFIAGQVLLLAGFILLCEPIVAIFQQVVELHQSSLGEGQNTRLVTAARICRIALIVALGLGVYACTKIGPNESTDTQNEVKTLREANAGIVVGTTVLVILGSLLLVSRKTLSMRHSVPIFSSSVCILIVASYKLDTALHPTQPVSKGTKAAFYILLALPEWLATLPLFCVNLKATYWPPTYKPAPLSESPSSVHMLSQSGGLGGSGTSHGQQPVYAPTHGSTNAGYPDYPPPPIAPRGDQAV